jgi:hypothetical protein
MQKLSLVSLACTTALAIFPATLVGQTTDFTFTFHSELPTYDVSGSLMGTEIGNSGVYIITSGSGTFTDGASAPVDITLYAAPNVGVQNTSPAGFFYYDDLVTPGNPIGQILDNNGLLFTENGDTSIEINLYQNPSGLPGLNMDDGEDNVAGVITPGTFNISVPESGSLSMLVLCGFGLAGGLFFRDRQPRMLPN